VTKTLNNSFAQIPVVVLCGGRSIVFSDPAHEATEPLNKGLVRIRQRPLFWWVMHHYALHGANDFVLATGFQAERFDAELRAAGAQANSADESFTVSIAGRNCRVRPVATPPDATTASRLLACKPYIAKADRFALTYSDTLSNVDLSAELRFHENQHLVATLVAAKFPVRFRILGIRQGESIVRAFAPRPVIDSTFINGGFYLFNKDIWRDAYGLTDSIALETTPLELLAAAGQLGAFEHKCFWQNCDSQRDLMSLNHFVAGTYA
jgi:glucose-1-phosphate cytidylyltransferase